jgi:diazepam-binding inhibitor (GABA receptor modulator, acyl-CoA-binding protein)
MFRHPAADGPECQADMDRLPQGKYKRNAWKKLVDEGLTPEDAQKKYVDLVEQLKKDCGYDPEKASENVGGK